MDVDGSLQLLDSGHVRERDKALLRSILVGGVWNGFLLHKVKGQRVPCRFCGSDDGDGHLFFGGNALLHLLLRFVNTLSFMISRRWISRLGHVFALACLVASSFWGEWGSPLGWEPSGGCM